MEETNSAQRIVNEALKDESWDIGVNKIAALRTIKRTASFMETLGKRTQGLEPSDPVEITYGELNDLMSFTSPTSTSPSRPRPSAMVNLQNARWRPARATSSTRSRAF